MDKKNTSIFLAVIILAAVVVASGIIFTRTQPETFVNTEPVEETYSITPVTEADHILGNPDADVILVEYSDFRCPFCRDFHPTMNRLIREYGRDGEFAWVYRHFPAADAISGETTLSKTAAVASECVADIKNENAFWSFTNGVFLELEPDFTESDLRDLAISLEVDEAKYDECIISDKFDIKIDKNIKDGLSIYEHDPNFGTPYNIVITKSGTQTEIIGAQPYEIIEQIILQHSFPDSL
jgi:protein-disulfide isomerase